MRLTHEADTLLREWLDYYAHAKQQDIENAQWLRQCRREGMTSAAVRAEYGGSWRICRNAHTRRRRLRLTIAGALTSRAEAGTLYRREYHPSPLAKVTLPDEQGHLPAATNAETSASAAIPLAGECSRARRACPQEKGAYSSEIAAFSGYSVEEYRQLPHAARYTVKADYFKKGKEAAQ